MLILVRMCGICVVILCVRNLSGFIVVVSWLLVCLCRWVV